MDEIDIDGEEWNAPDDFYRSYFAALGAPEWHGRNLDALWDSLTAGGINERNPPFRIRIRGAARMSPCARASVSRFEALIREAEGEGHPVQIELQP